MMNRFRFTIVFPVVFSFFSIKNVYAYERPATITICSDCDFQNLDQAFSAIQRGDYDEEGFANILLLDPNGY